MQVIRITGPVSVEIIPPRNYEADMKHEMHMRMLRAAKSLQDKLRFVVSRPYPPASKPGEPPRRRTGVGRDAIRVRVGKTIEVYLDKSGKYMAYLESRMNRPWFMRTLQSHFPKMEAILQGG